MTQLADDLRAARALIDTPEKYEAIGIVDALLDASKTLGDFNAQRTALLGCIEGRRDNLTMWAATVSHADIMALFQRAIEAAESSHD